jgi:hypothetical protein
MFKVFNKSLNESAFSLFKRLNVDFQVVGEPVVYC